MYPTWIPALFFLLLYIAFAAGIIILNYVKKRKRNNWDDEGSGSEKDSRTSSIAFQTRTKITNPLLSLYRPLSSKAFQNQSRL